MNPNNRKARLLLKKYLEGKCTGEEIELLHRWYDELPDLSPHVLSEFSGGQPIGEALQDAVRNKISGRGTPVRHLVYRLSAAAAVIAILCLSAIWWAGHDRHAQPILLANAGAGVRRIVLPDSSVVWLNAHSSLRCTGDLAAGDRTVELDGEAYFDVAKKAGHPFRVESKEMVTEVLGTSFNIECYKEEADVRVALVTGSVRLARRDGRGSAAVLTAGQIAQVRDDSTAIAISSGDAGSYGAWKTGGFVLHEVPLENALQRLCHKYGYTVRLNFTKGRQKPLSVAFYQDSFEEMLAGLLYVNHLNYSMRDSVITVY